MKFMSNRKKLLIFLLCLTQCMLFMSGCSVGSELPEEYASGEERLPAFQQTPQLAEETMDFTREKQEDEDEPFTYTYAGLENGGKAVFDYVSYLETEEGCSVFDEDGAIQEDPTFSQESGSILVGRENEDGSGVFSLKISWDSESCTIVPVNQQGLKLYQVEETEEPTQTESSDDPDASKDGITILIEHVQESIFSDLKISEDKKEEYSFFAQDGYVKVDDDPAICVNVYDTPTHTFQASYLISLDGEHLYRLNRSDKQVVELPLK